MVGFILLSLSLSLDSLGAGFTYGLKDIRISALSRLLFFLTAALCSLIATNVGHLLSDYLSSWVGSILSVLILLGLGTGMLLTSIREQRSANPKKEKNRKQIHWVWEFLGLTITVVRHPAKGDLDASNSIDPKEAVLLGMALSLDAFGVGVGYGLVSSLWVFPLLTSVFHFLFLSLGQAIGKRLHRKIAGLDGLISFLPGLVLILLGLLHGLKL